MIKINENKELIDFEKELKNNGYKYGKSIFSSDGLYEKIYYIGKSWKNVKLENSAVLGSISISSLGILKEDSIEWAIYFCINETNGNILWVKDVPNLLLEQFNKSAKVLYDEVKKYKVFISKEPSSLSRKHGDHLKFNIYSKDLPISEGIKDVRKLLKALPSIVKRIDSIMVYKQRGRF